MATQIDFQSLIDIGFVVLVTVACLRTFVRDGSGSDARRHAWKAELKELEGVLRGLIEEAGAASRNLDRNLMQRKRELEGLLKKIDGQSASTPLNASPSPYRAQPPPVEEDELPNETWLEGNTGSSPNRSSAKPKRTGVDSLESLIEQADDTVSLSQRVTREVLRQQAAAQKSRGVQSAASGSVLQAYSEGDAKNSGDLDPLEEETFRQTSIMDPVTYRIARRLLRAGKELHVVARKVELPVAEIRLLERLLREEDKRRNPEPETQPVTLQQQIEKLQYSDRNAVGRTFAGRRSAAGKPGQASPLRGEKMRASRASFEQMKPGKSQSSKELDSDIEREIALL